MGYKVTYLQPIYSDRNTDIMFKFNRVINNETSLVPNTNKV